VIVGGEVGVSIAFSGACAACVVIAALLVALVVEAIGEGDDVVGDVQRFIELTAEARASFPDGSLLSDPRGETSAAIGPFLAKKDEARRALWESRDRSTLDEEEAAHDLAARRLANEDRGAAA
jgi:hypothetical protein